MLKFVATNDTAWASEHLDTVFFKKNGIYGKKKPSFNSKLFGVGTTTDLAYWSCCGAIVKNSICTAKFTIGGHTGKYHCGHVGDCECYGNLFCECIDECKYSPHWTCCNESSFHSTCENWLAGKNMAHSVSDIPKGMGIQLKFVTRSGNLFVNATICNINGQKYALTLYAFKH